ncbi:hypothetical protein DIPPA_22778, partial [Diplonema papillatum]
IGSRARPRNVTPTTPEPGKSHLTAASAFVPARVKAHTRRRGVNNTVMKAHGDTPPGVMLLVALAAALATPPPNSNGGGATKTLDEPLGHVQEPGGGLTQGNTTHQPRPPVQPTTKAGHQRDTPHSTREVYNWSPPIRPSTVTSAGTQNTNPRRPSSLSRHAAATPVLLPPRYILLRSLTRKQRRLHRDYDRRLARQRTKQEEDNRKREHRAQSREMLIFAQETTPGATTQHSAQPAGPLYLSLDYYIGETTADEKEARSTAPAGDPDLPGLPPTNRRKDRSNDAPTSQLHRIAPEIAHPTATASQPGSEQAAPSTAPPGTEAHIATTHTAADEQHPEGTKGPSAQTTARTNFFVQGLDGKRHLVAAHLDERLGDVLERHMPANLEAYVIRGSGAPLPLDQPLESIGFESGMSPGVAVCARMHGGGGGGRGKVHVRVVRPGAAHATHSAAGAGGRGGRGHAGGGDPRAGHHANTSGRGSTNVDDKRTTQRPTPERNQQPEANNRDEQGGHKLYGGWEWPETRFRYVLPWTETSGSWEEVTRQPYSWAQSCLHRTVNRNIINSCWNDSAETSFTKGELHRELRMEFSTPQANEEEVLRCSGHGGFIERTEHDDDTPSPYVNIMLNEGTALHEAHEIASRISDWQLGLTYCRGTLGIRVRREQAKQLRAQLPEAPPEVGYFLVSGVPCGTNAHHLRAKLDSLGWTAQPLFKTAKNGRHIEWAVKSEVLPGKYNHTTHDGIRLTIRRTKRLPLEPTGPNRCPRLSNELRSAETHRRHDPSRPKDNDRLSFQQFQARHGNKAATVWEIAGALDADRPEIDEFDEGAPFAGGELVGAADDDEAGREGGSPQTNPPSINNDGGNSPPNNGQLVVCTDSIFRRPISKEAERAMFCIAMRDRERRREDKVLEGVPRKALPTTTRVDERAKAHSTQAILQKRESAEKRTRRRNSLPAPASPPTPLPIIRDPATPTHVPIISQESTDLMAGDEPQGTEAQPGDGRNSPSRRPEGPKASQPPRPQTN